MKKSNTTWKTEDVPSYYCALASFFVPGLGQVFQKRQVRAMIYFVLALVLWRYLLGWIVHFIAFVDAYCYSSVNDGNKENEQAHAHADKSNQKQSYHESENKTEARGENIRYRDLDIEKKYGQVLGLKGRVSMDDVRKAFRIRMAEYHPDKVAHLGPKLRQVAEEETKAIVSAYNYLKSKYDKNE